ncbi:class I SAM-dependent methyltransferase [Polyangium sorediatum]|uniref:Methyltransferase domain-containing protein n=1 Tax=Polyangium sorediatum TaxID=889274 RepID=A0ABT6NV60_9BACT|nr:class I SAM-dependent methyltransferase [Polyangium sorediatum]MDI1432005.1 methyltransferase domain-containing protein [Polyangium sorediatum]
MGSQYDTLAAITNLTAELPLRKYYEEYTFFQALGDIKGRSVLDVACGTGLYSRRFQQRGAARVVGIDNSEGMIDYARHLEASQPLGIEYHVLDAASARGLGTFDVVAATYLLHYAPTREVLRDMCTSLFASLASGGRLVSICMSPDMEFADASYYRKYGFEVASHGEGDGDVATLTSVAPGLPFTISAHHWSRATYEEALRGAGFREIVWHPPQIAPEGITALGTEFWTEYLRRPHAEVLSCVK